MGKLCKIYGKIEYTSMGNDGYDVSCIHASWIDNVGVFDNKDDISDDSDDYKRVSRKRK